MNRPLWTADGDDLTVPPGQMARPSPAAVKVRERCRLCGAVAHARAFAHNPAAFARRAAIESAAADLALRSLPILKGRDGDKLRKTAPKDVGTPESRVARAAFGLLAGRIGLALMGSLQWNAPKDQRAIESLAADLVVAAVDEANNV